MKVILNQDFVLHLTQLLFPFNAETIESEAFFKITEFTIRNDLASNIIILVSSFFFSTIKTFAFSSGIYLQILHGMNKK